ncbi:MAG: RsmB/NOP family class I SAM-dependent RNA methyltransferase [Alphaproteobacteria bacterium]|nr:RsmB/NOP family class I SAM-dependent RNA methyltransferase [Alphaproteobacteria bacterium]
MKLAGRVSAAIDVIAEITTRNRPASEALKDWGKAHRFAGSTDRHVVGTLVFDTLRRRNSAAALMGAETPRALVLGALGVVWQIPVNEIAALCEEQFGAGKLAAAETAALQRGLPQDLPAFVAGDFPKWLEAELTSAFGPKLVPEMAALATRAPVDLRVNTLKATHQAVAAALAKFAAAPTRFAPTALRIPAPGVEVRNVNVEAEPTHGLGQFEVQDEASQIAAALTGARPGEAVLDLCAGAGGKSLALAALMNNQGSIIAHDRDKHRLRPIFERIARAGASCIEVVAADEAQKLARPKGYDLVVVDAPCTGSGTWRRKPDAKWRLGEKQLQVRLNEQAKVLEQAAPLVRPGGRLAYFTCSVLPCENAGQVKAFLKAHADYEIAPYAEQWRATLPGEPPASAAKEAGLLQLTPLDHGCDGFFVAILRRKG